MAYLQALSGIARAGVTYAGWVEPTFVVTIGGVNRTAKVELGGWSVTARLGAPSVCTFTVKNLTPTLGKDVKVRYAGGNGDDLFGGTLLQAEAEVVSPSLTYWHCVATGYQWKLGLWPVQRAFTATAINTILANLLADYTNREFRVGYCPLDERVTIEFNRDTLSSAIAKLASLASAGAFWRVLPDKTVDICAAYPVQDIGFTNATAALGLRYSKDLTQVRTKTRVVGIGTTVTAAVAPGATTIPVAEVGWFDLGDISASSGEAICGANDLTYTGRTPSNVGGPGTLTGVAGITSPIAEGDTISVCYSHEDATAAAAMAALLTTPSDGVLTHWVSDSALSLNACKIRAEADIALYSSDITTIEFGTGGRNVGVGQLVAASVTSPVSISGDYLVQQVVTTPFGPIKGTSVPLNRRLTGALALRRLGDILARIQ